MRLLIIIALVLVPFVAGAQPPPYRVMRTVRVGGDGGFDYVTADSVGRRLYVARSSKTAPRLLVFDLDSLEQVGVIDGVNAHGAVVDHASQHGFASSNPVVMFDIKSLKAIKPVAVDGTPDGLTFDNFNHRVYVLSHSSPEITAIDTADGAVVGTIALGAAPEQSVSDGQGRLYVDLETANQVAVIDARSLTVVARYGLDGRGGVPVGLALDPKNHVLFVACRDPSALVMLNADTGAVLGAFPIGMQNDGVVFNPVTMEALASQGDGTLVVIKETAPRQFALEQTLVTKAGARTLTLDAKTGRILLITADYEPPPAGAPSPPVGRIARGPMIPDSFVVLEVGR